MKSTIKSAFAIIAVALMIMVAVVPMVGVFTEDSSATAQNETDPATQTGKIRMTFTLYDANAKLTTGGTIKVTWGTDNVQYLTYTSGATTETTFSETKMTNAKAVVGSGTGASFKADTDFTEYVIGDVSAGAVLKIDLYKGYKQSGDITFNAAGSTGTVYNAVKSVGTKIVMNYSLARTSTGEGEIEVGPKEATLDSSSKFKVDYPVTESTVYVKVNYITVGDTTVYFTSAWTKVEATTTLTAEQAVFTVKGYAGYPDGTVGNLASAAGAVTSFTTIDATIGTTNDDATFIYTSATALTDISYTLTFGSVTISNVKNQTTSNTGVPDLAKKAIFGTYKMGIVNASDAAVLKFTATATIGEESKTSDPVTAYVKGGYYIAVAPTVDGATAETSYTYKAVVDDLELETVTPTPANAAVAISAKAAGSVTVGETTTKYNYTLVTVTVTNASAGFQVTVNGLDGAKTFGLNDNKGVIAGTSIGSATFSFYVQGDRYISFTAQDGSEFNDASSGEYFIPTSSSVSSSITQNVSLTLKDKVMNFVFTDGDGESIVASAVTIGILTMTLTTDYTVTNSTNTKTVTLKDASLDVSKLKVYFNNITTETVQTFAASSSATAVAYTPIDGKMAVSSLEKTFYVTVKDADGNILSVQPNAYKASAYVAEDGTKIYSYDDSSNIVTLTAMSNGSYSYRVVKDLVGVTLSGVAQDTVIFKVTSTTYYFNSTPYLATAGMTISAKADSLSATIYKTDKVTPIANTEFKLMTASTSGTLIDVGVTDKDGKITFTSDAKIPSGATIMPTVATGLGTITKVGTIYVAEKNIFTVSITDADGAAFSPGSTGTFTMTGGSDITVGKKAITVSSTAKAGDLITVTLKDSDNAIRTFDAYTLTADNIKNGTISLVSNESTYTVSAVDADGKTIGLNTDSTKIKTRQGATYTDITAGANVVYKATATTVSGFTSKISYVITAPADGVEYVADIVGSNTSYGLTAGVYYSFNEKNAAVAESTMSTITFELVEANGASIYYGLSLQTSDPVKVGTTVCSNIAGTNKYYFVGDATATNKVTVLTNELGENSYYSFEPSQKIVGGVVKANQQTVYFTAVDAAGLPINDSFILKTVAANGAIADTGINLSFDENGTAYTVLTVDSTKTYKLVDDGFVYTFVTDGTKFTAAEQTVNFSFAFANGFALPADVADDVVVSSITYISKDGVKTTVEPASMKADAAYIIINTTDVASYVVKLGTGVATGITSVAFTGTTGNVVSDYSVVSGFVDADATKANVSYFNGTTQVATGTLTLTNGEYLAAFDFVNGGYDKALVQYYVSGVLKSQATIDAKTGYVADLVSVTPVAETLKAKVLDYNTSYVKLAFANGEVYLTADDKYTVETVDGLYVQTYKFAGWYVNGVKLTDDLNCAVDNVDTNVVSANYVLDDSKELGKESASGISPTVLVIGIAAVIIALIAVVYAVIQKKE